MLKITVTNKSIIDFYNNAELLTRQLSTGGQRSRYLGVLQFQKENFEKHAEAINKKLQRIQENLAKVNSSGEFVYDGTGNEKSYVFTKENKIALDEQIESYLNEEKQLEVDDVYYLREKDLPKNDKGEIIVSNNLLKALCYFAITKELCDKLIYPGLNEIDKED